MERAPFTILTLLLSSALCLSGQGTITTFAITPNAGMAVDSQGTFYVTDPFSSHVRKISSGTISTIGGNGNFGYAGDGGSALSASLFMGSGGIFGTAVDGAGNVYFSDSYNNVVRKITPAGTISTYAGNGTGAGTGFGGFAGDGGTATLAQLGGPGDLAMDANGNLYICDTDNNRVRKVTPAGVITTFAGNGNATFSGDNGQATAAGLPSPGGIAVDGQGNVYISSSRRIRKVTPNGVITTIAGIGTAGFSGDGGPATSAQFRAPLGLGVDQFGNVYVADNSNGRVRKIDAAGIITTYAGIDGNASTPLGDGGPATSAYLGNVGDLTVDASGNVYVSMVGVSGRIRKIATAGAGFVASPSSLSFSATTGGPSPATQTLTINSSGSVLGFIASTTSTGAWLYAQPATGTTPASLTVGVNPAGLGAGTYNGTVMLSPAGSGNSPLAIPVTLTVTGAGSPVIDSGRINNASGYQSKLAPGTVFVIFGSNMGPAAIQVASAPDYPTVLAGTSVTFTPTAGGNPIQAKMVYTLAGQIAGVLPSSIAPGTYAVRVSYNGLTSAPQNVNVVLRSFGIAAANSGGTGTAQASIGNVNNGISLTRFRAGTLSFGGLDWTLTPAHPGDTIVLWGTGGGADAANDTGGTSGDQTSAGNFRVTIGTRTITPLYAGASFGYPGLWQINVTLPSDIAPDCFTNVSVAASGEVSNTVTVPIAAPGQPSCVDSTMPAAVLTKLDAGGEITVAGFTVARVTETLSNTTQELASGNISRFTAAEWTILNSGPVFGACRVYDRTYAQNGKDPAAPESLLDAGASLPLSGPGLPGGFALGRFITPSGPAYSNSPSAGTYRQGTYNLSGAGGSQVGAFSATVNFPGSFAVTNWDGITSIDRSKPLTVDWIGTGLENVGMILSTAVLSNGTLHVSTINCTVPGNLGTYTIPTSALAYLSPASVSGTAYGSFSVQAVTNQNNFTASLSGGGQLDIGALSANLGVAKNIAVQ